MMMIGNDDEDILWMTECSSELSWDIGCPSVFTPIWEKKEWDSSKLSDRSEVT